MYIKSVQGNRDVYKFTDADSIIQVLDMQFEKVIRILRL